MAKDERKVSAEKLRFRLALWFVALLLICGVAIAGVLMFVSLVEKIEMLDTHLNTLPKLLQERKGIVEDGVKVYNRDYLTRQKLAKYLYELYGSEPEELEKICELTGLNNVAVYSSDGNLQATARQDRAALYGQEDIAQMLTQLNDNPEGGCVEISRESEDQPDRAVDLKEEQAEENAGTDRASEKLQPIYLYGLQMEDGTNFIIEVDSMHLMSLVHDRGEWGSIIERTFSGIEGYFFAISENGDDISIAAYPSPGDDAEQMGTELEGIFKNRYSYTRTGNDPDSGFVDRYNTVSSMLGRLYIVYMAEMDAEENTWILMMLPSEEVVHSALMTTLAILACMAVTMYLLTRYVYLDVIENPVTDRERKAFRHRIHLQGIPGLAVSLTVAVLFSLMIISLDSMTKTADTAIEQRKVLESERAYNLKRESEIRNEHEERYLIRAKLVATVLNDHPERIQKHALRELSDLVQADYIMLYDKSGQEYLSSNTYTGFSVSKKPEDPTFVFQPVLMGYEHVISEIRQDAITGRRQYSIAVLLTGKDGDPNGFVRLAIDADELADELSKVSIRNVIRNYTLMAGQEAAVVDLGTRKFAAHSDESLIGMDAADYLSGSVIDRSNEGFVSYRGSIVYLSADINDSENLMILSNDSARIALLLNMVLIPVIVLMIGIAYYLLSAVPAAQLAGISSGTGKDGPPAIMIYGSGLSFFLACFALFAYVTSQTGTWTMFRFVFSRNWTKGVHLFSLWAALFMLAVGICLLGLVKKVLKKVDEQLKGYGKTFVRLTSSLLTYIAVIGLAYYIFAMFGVNTAAIWASAGILSIAVGMGARNLVTDILAGLFMIFEGSIHVGDIVLIGNWRGVVTDLGIRTMEVTNESQDVKIITNSHINDIVNMSRIQTACTMEFNAPRTEPEEEVIKRFQRYEAHIRAQLPELSETLHLDGITNITQQAYTVRFSYQCNESERNVITYRLHNEIERMIEEEKNGGQFPASTT